MSATVHSIADADPKPDAEKSAVTLNYEEMLAALNGLLAEMREERRQAEASGSIVDALSFPRIISARIYDVSRTRLAW